MKALIASILLVCASQLFGATYYLWNGANGNGSFATPFNWAGGVSAANNGDTFIIRSNNYFTGPITTAGKINLTIKAELKWTAGVTNTTTWGLHLFKLACSGMTLDGLVIAGAQNEDGLAINFNTGVTVINCWIHDNGQNGINSTTGCHGNTFDSNLIEHNGRNPLTFHYHGLYVSGQDNVIRNNIIRENLDGTDLQIYSEDAGGLIYNNFVYNNLIYGGTNEGYCADIFGATYNGVPGGTNPGTNYVFGNTILGTLYTHYGKLFFTNNVLTPAPGQGPFAGLSNPSQISGDYNAGITALLGSAHEVVTSWAGLGFLNTNKGLYYLTTGSLLRGAALSSVSAPMDFYGAPFYSATDIGYLKFDSRRLAATITLDPSSIIGANYWVTNDPSISVQPTSQTVASGGTATFSVTAAGTPTLGYQWYSNTVPISGATASSYTTPATTPAFNGITYYVAITSPYSVTNSANAGLTVTGGGGTAPSITAQPSNQSVACGSTATFNVTASGTPPLTYYWMKNGVAIGPNANSYTTPATDSSYDGVPYSVLVSNAVGTATSATANLAVTGCFPTITVQPSPQTVVCGATATFSVTATSSLSLGYQWQKNSVNIGGATSSSYTTPATDQTYNGVNYDCIVSTTAGNVTSQNAKLTVTGCTPNIATVTSLKVGNAYIGP